jgi:hypothetical protein
MICGKKIRVGAIHEAAVLFGGSLRIKNRQDIAPCILKEDQRVKSDDRASTAKGKGKFGLPLGTPSPESRSKYLDLDSGTSQSWTVSEVVPNG